MNKNESGRGESLLDKFCYEFGAKNLEEAIIKPMAALQFIVRGREFEKEVGEEAFWPLLEKAEKSLTNAAEYNFTVCETLLVMDADKLKLIDYKKVIELADETLNLTYHLILEASKNLQKTLALIKNDLRLAKIYLDNASVVQFKEKNKFYHNEAKLIANIVLPN